MRSDCIFFCPIRVRYGEVDKQGIVYNGNYFVYTDTAFEEFFRTKGYPYSKLVSEYGAEVCHKKSTTEFIASAYDGDLIEVGVRVHRIGEKSITIGFEIYREGEEIPIVISQVVYVGYDTEARKSKEITDIMKQLLERS